MASSDTITMYRGEDVRLNFTMTPTEDITGWTILFTMRGGGIIISVAGVVVNGPDGTISIDLEDTDTDDLAPGRYDYDVWRVDDGSEQPIAVGALTLLAGPRDTTV